MALYYSNIESLNSNQKSETWSARERRGVVYSLLSPSSIFHRDKYFAVMMDLNNLSDFSHPKIISLTKRAYLKTALFDVHIFLAFL